MKRVLWSYVKKHKKGILMYFLFGGIFFLVFYLYGSRLEAVGYAFLLSGLIGLIAGGIDFLGFYKKHKELEQLKYNITSELMAFPKAAGSLEEEYQTLIQMLYGIKEKLESEACIGRQDMLDYYSLWAHQIKTPISAMGLLLQSARESEYEDATGNGQTIQSMKIELFKIEQYVEMVLSYLRMEEISSDLVLQWYSVSDIVKQVVRKYSPLFILKKIKLEFSSMEDKVLTDEKWLVFVLEQILSNALKYTKEGTISIYMSKEQQGTIIIKDSGMGIQAEDLPRVFEKGFTGYNGRKDKKSTGIGLYLCKMIMNKLNHQIEIISEIDVGTSVLLHLYRKERQME